MTLDEFNLEFDRMVKAFGATRSEDRGEVYYERLKKYDWRSLRAAVTAVLDESSKFPTISEIRERMNSKSGDVHQAKAECLLCDGWGWVSKYNTAYRAPCKHSESLCQKILMWPLDENEQRRLLRNQAEEELKIYGRWPEWATAEGLMAPEEQ